MTVQNWQIVCEAPKSSLFFYEEAFDGVADAFMHDHDETPLGLVKMTLIFGKKPDARAVAAAFKTVALITGQAVQQYEIVPLQQKDWLKESLLSFPPVAVGKFYIYGRHIKKPQVPDGLAGLVINAATAFGSGEHHTTKGCLTALSDIKGAPKNVLDMGCGSGILGIAAARLFGARVLAVDIDPEAVRVTAASAFENKVGDMVTARAGNGFRTAGVRANAPYDLILANILARPLIKMAPACAGNLRQGGRVIISGFLDRHADWVIGHYKKLDMKLEKEYILSGWVTAVLRKEKA